MNTYYILTPWRATPSCYTEDSENIRVPRQKREKVGLPWGTTAQFSAPSVAMEVQRRTCLEEKMFYWRSLSSQPWYQGEEQMFKPPKASQSHDQKTLMIQSCGSQTCVINFAVGNHTSTYSHEKAASKNAHWYWMSYFWTCTLLSQAISAVLLGSRRCSVLMPGMACSHLKMQATSALFLQKFLHC